MDRRCVADMSKPLREIMRKRGELVARIAAQREQVTLASVRWKAPLAVADQGLAAVRYVRSHPLILAGVVALLAIRRNSVIGVAGTALRLWNLYNSTRNYAAKAGYRR